MGAGFPSKKKKNLQMHSHLWFSFQKRKNGSIKCSRPLKQEQVKMDSPLPACHQKAGTLTFQTYLHSRHCVRERV